LRHTWLSRLPLLEPGRTWFARPRTSRAARCWQPPQRRPALEGLEDRWSPNDPLGIMQAPLLWGGLALLPGTVVSPRRVLASGWPLLPGTVVSPLSVLANDWPDGVAPTAPLDAQGQAPTTPSAGEKPLSDEEIEALFAPWSRAARRADSGDASGDKDRAANADA